MAIKSKILGVACAVTIVGTGLIGITYANENHEFIKGKFHNCLSMMDFSQYETLTDSQKEELTGLQAQLKEIRQEEKVVRAEMEEILEEAGVEVKTNLKKEMKMIERKELTEEERTKIKEKFSLTEEEKAELKANKEFIKVKKEKMFDNKSVIED